MARPRFSIQLLHFKYWLVWLAVGLWWFFVQILPYKLQMFLGSWLGRLMARYSEQRSVIARKNIELCFPNMDAAERERLFLRNMESLGKGFFDIGIAWFWPYYRQKKLLEVRGLEHLSSVQQAGQGVLLLGLHFISLELGIVGIDRQNPYPVSGVFRRHANLAYDYIQRNRRERNTAETVFIPREDVRAMVRALRRGQALGYMPDQDYGAKHSVFVPFFGVDTATVVAPSQLARLGRAKVLAYRAMRKTDGGGYLIEIYPALEGFGEGSELDDAKCLSQFVEDRVRECPEEYLWVHRRFKTRPNGEEDFYSIQHTRSYQRRMKRRKKRSC